MAQTRSPRYPNVSLGEAISKARLIYDREHMSPLTPKVAAEAMGYSGINGASLKMISSLKKYGLLEGRGDDVRLTKDAQTLIIDDQKSKDYRDALRRSALNPEVFLEIHRQFQNVGSERNISVYLEKQGFKPDAASTVAQNFKETMALVAEGGPTYDDEGKSEEDRVQSVQEVRSAQGATSPLPPYRGAGLATGTAASMPSANAELPFTILMRGKQLEIMANVDLRGLQQLKSLLDQYEVMLKMMESVVPIVPSGPIKQSLISAGKSSQAQTDDENAD